ncbi:hypothetical protein RSOLAG22IIIB_12937 [Rhizoctonia solani]|uniref:Uncharacterized protein n=1 Tax=Rhizoctonia solani TaxID=456999 RepID=A0A0K6GHY9_9AGAM|nr:hypothetical protein RSOLAG22IIIB_12937 [Rhizoctonia solani]
MAQKQNPQEKQVSKDTPGISQFCESIDEGKKCQEANEQKKLLKEQGVGLMIPASLKCKIQPNEDELPDENFDATLAKISAEDAQVDAWCVKLAKHNGLQYKKPKKIDGSELQQLWDAVYMWYSDSDKQSLHNCEKATDTKCWSMDNTNNSGANTGSEEGNSNLEMEDGDGNGNGSGDKSTKYSQGKTAYSA